LRHFSIGMSIFVVGLFKKAFLADLVATFVSPVFDAAAAGTAVHTADAWTGVLAYTLQIYFDFSGYSDMAIGLAAMFGIVLPFNFASPYRATSIIDFWRRWHITLSRFLRVYLYVPLGGNRKGPGRRYLNLMLVMLIGGLWHGAAWTFVAWGGLHGIYLMTNHFWRSRTWFRPQLTPAVVLALRVAAWSITLFAVIVAWVFFRADTFAAAALLLKQMSDPSGFIEMLRYGLQPDGLYAGVAFAQTNSMNPRYITVVILLALAICLAMPNTQSIFTPSIERWVGPVHDERPPSGSAIHWQPSPAWGVTIGFAAASALMAMTAGSSPFLYFNF
jgi:alginate O-acetyltransferase complex protein AlgI